MKNDVNTKKFLVVRRFGVNDNSDFFDDNNNTMPDIEFTFSCDLSIEIMKLILNGLDDCHVMSETLQVYELYTGERR